MLFTSIHFACTQKQVSGGLARFETVSSARFVGCGRDDQIPGLPKTEEQYKPPRINTNTGIRAAEASGEASGLTPLE